MRNHFFRLLLFFSLSCTTYLAQAQSSYATDRLLVTFNPIATAADVSDAMADVAATTLYVGDHTDVHHWQIGPYPISAIDEDTGDPVLLQDIIDVQRHVAKKARVNDAGLDYIVGSPAPSQLNVPHSGGYHPVPSCPASDLFCPPHDYLVRIGVIDTGISDNVEASLNGDVVSGYNISAPYAPPIDNHGHGSQMAGIIGDMVEGPCEIMPIKALGDDGNGNLSDIVRAIDYAIEQQLDIINLSFGYTAVFDDDSGDFLKAALERAADANILIVVSAGNTASKIGPGFKMFYPASMQVDNMITVGATACVDPLAGFSNFGDVVDLHAPGVQVLCRDLNAEWVHANGTSHAAAIVTALAAQLATHQSNFSAEAISCALIDHDLNTKQVQANHALNRLLDQVCTAPDPDHFLLQQSNTSPSVNTATELPALHTFPNPATGVARVQYQLPQQEEPAQLVLLNAQGQFLEQIDLPASEDQMELPVQQHPAGLYFLRLVAQGQVISSQRLIIAR